MRSTLGIVLRRSRPIRRPLILCVAASPNSGRLDAASLELRLRWPCAKLFMSCFEPAEEACIAAISGRRRWRLCGEDPHPGGQLRRGQHACVSTHERPWLRQWPGARQLVPACLPASPIAAFLSFLLRPPSQHADDGHRRRRSGRRSVCRLCRRGRRRACCRRARAGRSAGAGTRAGCSASASCACARRPASACCARHRRWSAAVNGRQGLLQRGQGLVSRLRLTLLARLPDRSWYLSFSVHSKAVLWTRSLCCR